MHEIYHFECNGDKFSLRKCDPTHTIMSQYVSGDKLTILMGCWRPPITAGLLEFIKELNLVTASTIVIDCSEHVLFEGEESYYQTILQWGLTKSFCILTSISSFWYNPQPNSLIKFFPTWILFASANYKFWDNPKKYKLSCLNGNYVDHRTRAYLALTKKSYFNDIVFSFGNRGKYYINNTSLTASELEEFSHLPQQVTFVDDDAIIPCDTSTRHPAYQETYINLVTETNAFPTALLSEKTFKPIISGQLFVLIAAPKSIQFLRDIGIDTFDDIIDHSYDNIADSKLRIDAALMQIDRLMTLDLEQIYTQIKSRLLRNSEYATSNEFREQFLINGEINV